LLATIEASGKDEVLDARLTTTAQGSTATVTGRYDSNQGFLLTLGQRPTATSLGINFSSDINGDAPAIPETRFIQRR
jgi:hypothetical protein